MPPVCMYKAPTAIPRYMGGRVEHPWVHARRVPRSGTTSCAIRARGQGGAAVLATVRPLGVQGGAGLGWAGRGPGGPTWPLGRWLRQFGGALVRDPDRHQAPATAPTGTRKKERAAGPGDMLVGAGGSTWAEPQPQHQHQHQPRRESQTAGAGAKSRPGALPPPAWEAVARTSEAATAAGHVPRPQPPSSGKSLGWAAGHNARTGPALRKPHATTKQSGRVRPF
jgi:hypothetical protein